MDFLPVNIVTFLFSLWKVFVDFMNSLLENTAFEPPLDKLRVSVEQVRAGLSFTSKWVWFVRKKKQKNMDY